MVPSEPDVPVRRVVTTDPETARVLDDGVRAKTLDMLADEEMAVAEVQGELQRRGEDKAETTVRHHLGVLEDAGLVELSRREEAGGGTRKYYRSNTRVFSYDLPEGADETLAPAQATAVEELRGLVGSLYGEHGDAIRSVAGEMTPCEYCERQRYEEFVVRELLDRALVTLGEAGALDHTDGD